MIGILESAFVLIALLIAAIFDIKTREVPDILSYSFIALGFANGLVRSIVEWNYLPILAAVLGFVAMLLLSLLLFYTGQWGGGDSKLLMGLGAWFGVWFGTFPLIGTYLVNTVLIGGFYGLAWSIYLIASHRESFLKELKKLLKKYRLQRGITSGLIFVLLLASLFLFPEIISKLIGLGLCLMLLAGAHLWIIVKAVEKVCFYKWISPKKLTEGDWVVRPIREGKKILVKPSDFGVTKEQIAQIVKLHGEGRLEKVLIKEGIPFVPPMFLAGLMTVLFQNWILRFF